MPKKIIKRKKIKIIPVLVLILIFILSFFTVKFLLHIKIQNIYITGNVNLNDEYIIKKAGLSDYPSLLKTMSWMVKERLEKDKYIEKVTVDKSLLGTIEINIVEAKVLLYKEYNRSYVLTNNEEVTTLPYKISPVRVINYIPDTVYPEFIRKYSEIKEEIRNKISQIKYDPSEYDDNRFIFYMNDGNYVYITIYKLDTLNYYNDIYPTLEGKKGILYLDSGNHFKEF